LKWVLPPISTAPVSISRDDVVAELHRISSWWLDNSIDDQQGGFFGEVDYQGHAIAAASKSAVLNSRILWFFSESALFGSDSECRRAADRAFQYLIDYFDDSANGGVYWALSSDGSPVDGKKQIYAQTFYMYGLAAYYSLTSDPDALRRALQYFDLIEARAKDKQFGGYQEAFTETWGRIADVRLSTKDLNAPKTMNTHLHILEAYTALHRAAVSPGTASALRGVISLFLDHIVDSGSGHLKLFFDDQWNSLSSVVSFGHDIEASWLLWEAGEVLGDPAILENLKPVVLKLADSSLRKGLGDNHQLCSEFCPDTQQRSEEGIWWVQAEALVGFLNAYQLTTDSRFLSASTGIWRFISTHQFDHAQGEWHAVTCDGGREEQHYKAGFWKGPYHNGRAMMEACRRLEEIGLT